MAQRRAKKILEESGLNRKEWEELIDNWIFNAEHREILKLFLLDGIGYEALAEKYGYSVTWIRKIIYKAEERIFRKI